MRKRLKNLSRPALPFKVFSPARLARIAIRLRHASVSLRRLRPSLTRLGEACLDLIQPAFCRECDALIGGRAPGFCERCLARIEWIGSACARCGVPIVNPPPLPPGWAAGEESPQPPPCGSCLSLNLSFDLASAGGRYTGSLRRAVLRYKFQGDRAVLPLLVSALRRAAGAPHAAPWIARADAIVPVPLHPFKRWWKGWSPVLELARELNAAAETFRVPPVLPLLAKTRWTPSQMALPEDARRRNLKRAFAAVPGQALPAVAILLDDVLTTGTTLSECAAALKRAGVQRVLALAVARS